MKMNKLTGILFIKANINNKDENTFNQRYVELGKKNPPLHLT